MRILLSSIVVRDSNDILEKIDNTDVVGIDEAQFFTDDLSITCNTLANLGIRVIVSGLDMDFQGKPFGYIPKLLAISTYYKNACNLFRVWEYYKSFFSYF